MAKIRKKKGKKKIKKCDSTSSHKLVSLVSLAASSWDWELGGLGTVGVFTQLTQRIWAGTVSTIQT